MSFAILSECEIDAPQAVASDLLEALFRATTVHQPIGRYAIIVSPETARLVRRIELVDEWAEMALYGLAKKVARYSARSDELLLIAIGDSAPRFRTISLARLRAAFGSCSGKETGQ